MGEPRLFLVSRDGQIWIRPVRDQKDCHVTTFLSVLIGCTVVCVGCSGSELRPPDKEEQQARRKELEREGKWMKMLFSWEKYSRSVKLRDRVRKGVPDKFRAEVRCPQMAKQLNLRLLGAPPPDPGRLRRKCEAGGSAQTPAASSQVRSWGLRPRPRRLRRKNVAGGSAPRPPSLTGSGADP